jgi:hypothetical protein
LDNQLVGHVAISDDIDEATMQAQAVNRLEASIGARVQVNQWTRTEPARAPGRDLYSYGDMIDKISRAFSYKIAAVAIYVEGQEIAVLKTQADADAVANRLMAPFRNDNTIDAQFVERWELRTKLVDLEDLDTAEDALLQLDKRVRTMDVYTVRSGDNLGAIALRNNITLEKLLADNTDINLTANTILRIGMEIKIETMNPLMSVRTIDELVRTETLPFETEQRDNPLEYITHNRVLEEGREGEQEITLRVTRVNGIQTGPEEVINTRTTVQPVTQVVEVGTSQTPPQRR